MLTLYSTKVRRCLIKTIALSTQKCLQSSFYTHNQLSMCSGYSKMSERWPIVSLLRFTQQSQTRTSRHVQTVTSQLKSCLNLDSYPSTAHASLLSRAFLSFSDNHMNLVCTHSAVNCLLQRGFHTKQGRRLPVENEEELEVIRQREEQKAAREQSAWMLRMSNENNYLSWCRNIYISTLVAYTTSILAPGHFTAEGVFIIIAFANLLFGTTSFIYTTLRLRQRMQMGFFGATYNVLLAVVHFVLYVTCISMYTPFSVEFIDEDDNNGIDGV